LKEENGKPVSELPAESQRDPGGLQEIENTAAVVECKEQPSRSGDAAAAQAIDDGVDRFFTTGVAPELSEAAESRNELNDVVHKMLLAGLAFSTIFIMVGLFLSSISHQKLPSAASSLRQVFQDLKVGAPSGFLNLGILVLIATPILRVFGSLAEFIYRRDWRYVAITSTVLLILAISVFAGRG
jgi:uncharacterized membrane protein